MRERESCVLCVVCVCVCVCECVCVCVRRAGYTALHTAIEASEVEAALCLIQYILQHPEAAKLLVNLNPKP